MAFCPLADIISSRLHSFADYLEGKRSVGVAPNRADIDPIIDVPHLAGTVLLLERIQPLLPDAGRFRIRLVGSELARVAKRDFTGRWLDEALSAPALEGPLRSLETIFAGTELFAGANSLPWQERAHVEIEWVAQRLASAPGTN